jgi:ADP-heptose:LPS heptosyltransferase
MRILIIQLRQIGDILLTTPVISYLKQVLGTAQIDFLTQPLGKQIVETHPLIDNLYIYDKKSPFKQIRNMRKHAYDAIFDFMGNPRTRILIAFSQAKWKVGRGKGLRSLFYNLPISESEYPNYVPLEKIKFVDAWLKKLNIKSQEPQKIRPELNLTPSDHQFVNDWTKTEGLTSPYVILIPTHRHPIRRWGEQQFQRLGLKINEKIGYPIYLAYGPGEEELINRIRNGHKMVIRALPQTTIRQMAAIFQKAKFIVTNDSGPMHIAVAVGTPTVTIYGPTLARDWHPTSGNYQEGGKDIPLWSKDVACVGCHLSHCPVGHICMTHMSVDHVFKACQELNG